MKLNLVFYQSMDVEQFGMLMRSTKKIYAMNMLCKGIVAGV
jgi:hypothetical protein